MVRSQRAMSLNLPLVQDSRPSEVAWPSRYELPKIARWRHKVSRYHFLALHLAMMTCVYALGSLRPGRRRCQAYAR